jgi:hypothetical protein
MKNGNSGAVAMGLGYVGLVVFLLLFCGWRTTTYDEFAKYWGLFGTIVGVVTGAIPAYFFKVKADTSDARAADADRRADREAQKAQLYAAAAGPEAQQIPHDHRELFEA